MRNSTRTIASTKNTPTPTATERIRVRLGMVGTWFASTWRSGSDTVIITPTKRDTRIITHRLRDLVLWEPTYSPMGVMEISAPRVKKPMPTISATAPTKKAISVPLGMGATVKHSASTSAVTGKTAWRDSRILARKIVLVFPTLFSPPFLY